MDPKPINFRPTVLDDLILERLLYDMQQSSGKKMSKSEIVRHCIKVAGADLIAEKDFQELLLHSYKFN